MEYDVSQPTGRAEYIFSMSFKRGSRLVVQRVSHYHAPPLAPIVDCDGRR